MKAYVLIIDHESCWGCKTCEVACKQENLAPIGIKLISVYEESPRIVEGKPECVFRINVCRHCEEPECVEACPEEAIFKRDDGLVVLDQETCVGCELCVEACPYDAIAFDAEEGIARKCNLCYHRVDQGLIPACADNVCLAHCIYFGGPKEIQEQIAEKHRAWSNGVMDKKNNGPDSAISPSSAGMICSSDKHHVFKS